MSVVKVGDTKQIVEFRDALYESECGDCGANLDWEASFDADGTTYSAECCGFDYHMYPSGVSVSREKQ